jgi:hypothetical protein
MSFCSVEDGAALERRPSILSWLKASQNPPRAQPINTIRTGRPKIAYSHPRSRSEIPIGSVHSHGGTQ